MKKSLFFVILLVIGSPVNASYFEVGKKGVSKVYDGDGIKIKVRLAYIDTPEIKGKCLEEKKLAHKAQAFTQKFMLDYPKYQIKPVGIGRYGRVLAEVRAGNKYLNQMLLDKGLARKYNGKRFSWC